MNPAIYVRAASLEDLPGMLEIYRPYVEETTITFEYDVPSLEEFRQRYNGIMPALPWLVCQYEGITAGYAYAARYHQRAAYQWNAELSVYIRQDYQGKHIGTALYRSLLRVLTLQGFLYAHALVTLPNQNSIRLHTHMGFRKVCVNEKTGFKLGVWRDVAELCLPLAEIPKVPDPPCPYNALSPETVVPIFREEAAKIAFP